MDENRGLRTTRSRWKGSHLLTQTEEKTQQEGLREPTEGRDLEARGSTNGLYETEGKGDRDGRKPRPSDDQYEAVGVRPRATSSVRVARPGEATSKPTTKTQQGQITFYPTYQWDEEDECAIQQSSRQAHIGSLP